MAILLGVPGILGAAVGAVVMIAGISLITRRTGLSSDTAIGLLFVGMLALGVVIVSRSFAFTGDLVRVLFGEILGISRQSILIQLVATPAHPGYVHRLRPAVPAVVLQPRAGAGGRVFGQPCTTTSCWRWSRSP